MKATNEKMTPRERVRRTINHEEPDRIPIDLGSSLVTSICASSYSNLKKALGIGGEVRVEETFCMLAEVEEEVMEKLGVDTYGIKNPVTFFGYKNENWKPFVMQDGTKVLVSGNCEYEIRPGGDIVQYPQGDRSARPSGLMPKDGFYFDVIVRQEPIVEKELDPKEWVDQTCAVFGDEQLREMEEKSKWYFENTGYSLVGNFWGAGFGDIGFVAGAHIKNPKGIRDPEEWYVSFMTRKGYIEDIFGYQYDIGMKNLKLFKEAMSDRIDVVVMGGTDFGSQNGPFISPNTYRELFKPLHKRMDDWVHAHTNWKTFYHTCGSNVAFLDDFVEAGFDILNPVQISAAGMDPAFLKDTYGERLVFWGGAVNPQGALAFGTADEVEAEVERNIRILGKGGGYVFSNIHNIQDNIPVENILAMFETAKEKGVYRGSGTPV
jgi:hypothetical protein